MDSLQSRLRASRGHNRLRVFVGFDAEEMAACHIARHSLERHATRPLDIHPISRTALWEWYQRETTRGDDGRLWDVISNAPMSTDHAIARFFIPWLCDYQGWALFVDGDILCRWDVAQLFDYGNANPEVAVWCVQHPPFTTEGYKKDYAIQTVYPRKNWSSVMLFHCGHPANAALTLDLLNTLPGRDLHRFCWLADDQIGELPSAWNYLVGVNPPLADPAIVHFTLGVPTLPGHADDPFAEEWFALAQQLGYRLTAAVPSLEQAG